MAGAARWWWMYLWNEERHVILGCGKHGSLSPGCSWQSVLLPTVTLAESTYEPCTCIPSSDVNWTAISFGANGILDQLALAYCPELLCFNPGFGFMQIFFILPCENQFFCLQSVRGGSSFLWPWHYKSIVVNKRRREPFSSWCECQPSHPSTGVDPMLYAHCFVGDKLKYHVLRFQCIGSQTLDNLGHRNV